MKPCPQPRVALDEEMSLLLLNPPQSSASSVHESPRASAICRSRKRLTPTATDKALGPPCRAFCLQGLLRVAHISIPLGRGLAYAPLALGIKGSEMDHFGLPYNGTPARPLSLKNSCSADRQAT